jgi:glutamine synthetase
MTEVRQVPDRSAHVHLPAYGGRAPFDLFLCDSLNPDRMSWDCCTQGFARRALAGLESEFGLRFVGAFEHEFTLISAGITSAPPFTVEALRVAPQFTTDLADALTQAVLEPETVKPELVTSNTR